MQNRRDGTHLVRTDLRPARGKDAVVVADPYQSVVGPTGRGITGDIVTFSHPDDTPLPRAKGKHVARRGGRSSRRASTTPSSSTARASTRSRTSSSPASGPTATTRAAPSAARNVAFVVELDGVHTIHLGDIGHLLTEEKLADIGPVDIACVPLGGSLSPTKAAELVAQLDPKIVVPMPVCDDDADCARRAGALLPRDGRDAERAAAEAVGHADGLPDRDDDRPAGVARQDLRPVDPGARRSAGARSQRHARGPRAARLTTTVRTRSAAGQYGIWVERRDVAR